MALVLESILLNFMSLLELMRNLLANQLHGHFKIYLHKQQKAFKYDAYHPLANCICFGGHHQMSFLGGPKVNKFVQVSSVGHQMSIAGGPRSDVREKARARGVPGMMSRGNGAGRVPLQ